MQRRRDLGKQEELVVRGRCQKSCRDAFPRSYGAETFGKDIIVVQEICQSTSSIAPDLVLSTVHARRRVHNLNRVAY